MIYFDNSATTIMLPEVREAMAPYLAGEYGNASSVHSLGSHARNALEEARQAVARAIHAEPKEIVFTSGGTEANNWAIKSSFFSHLVRGEVPSDFVMLTSPVEHHAVLGPAEWIEALGAQIEFVRPDEFGSVSASSIEDAAKYSLVSLMMVSNELGSISEIAAISKAIREKSKALIHSDAVQALGKLPIDVRELGVDLMTLSAHKIHGPKGIGALYIRGGVRIEPLLHGGSQERNRRGGTEAVALAVGFAEAVMRMEGHQEQIKSLRKYLIEQLAQISQVVLNSASDARSVDAIVSFTFVPEVLAKLDADTLIMRFDMEGIAVSNGSACTSGSQQPSHGLMALGKGKEVASKSVRVSFSRFNTKAEIDQLIMAIRTIL